MAFSPSTLVALALCLYPVILTSPAPYSKGNPKNIVAVADFPEAGPNKFTKGYVYFTSPKGDSVKVHVDMTGLPAHGGPFVYHIHEKQVFNKADCEEAGKHFDPYNGIVKCPERGDDSFCMVGDLSGKHGWINATCFQTEYHDKYISLNPASESYIIGKSLVFHDQELTRFACANINLASAEQHEYLFGEPGKKVSTSSIIIDSPPKHITSDHHVPAYPSPKKGDEPDYHHQPAPAPTPAPAPKHEPTAPSSPKHTPEPVKLSPPAGKSQTVEKSSTAGTIAKPTSHATDKGIKIDGTEDNAIQKPNVVPGSPMLVSSDAASSNFLKGLIGTVFGLLVGLGF